VVRFWRSCLGLSHLCYVTIAWWGGGRIVQNGWQTDPRLQEIAKKPVNNGLISKRNTPE
jgi:hypothetical protein